MDAIGIATKARGVPVDPGDGAPHLIRHRHQIAARLDHVDEVQDDMMRASTHEQFGCECIVFGETTLPRAAMHEDADWRVRGGRRIQIERLVGGWAIGDTAWRPQPLAGNVAVAGVTLQGL